VLPSSLSHTSPIRHISRRSSSPGRQLDGDAAVQMTMDHPVSGARMTQSFVNAGPGLLSMGSSASLMQYHYGAGANGNRSASGSFSGHKTKSLSLLVDRAAADSSNSNRRRMVGSAASHVSSVDQSTAHAAVLSSSNNSMSYDRDQSLDRHVERRHRQRNQREGIVNDNVSRYHTISGYGRDRGMSADREYPHMGARALERVENGLMRSRSIDPEIVPAEQSILFSSENTHHTAQDVMLELQSQVTDLNRECSALQRDLEGTREKLASSMNSVRTFWSPELKRERALRKEDSSKLSLMVEQLRMAEAENRVSLVRFPC
jgi:RIM-binding protein of the cytomatrix active zone